MKEPNVHVSILEQEKISFVLYGNFLLENQNIVLNGKFDAIVKDNEIIIRSHDQEYIARGELVLVPEDYVSETFLIRDVLIGINFHWEQKENQRFMGSLKLKVLNKKINAINILKVEDYLTSVISSEMSATSSLELLKAHAIISRSWLLAQMENRAVPKRKDFTDNLKINNENELITWYDREDHVEFDICADDHCQRYQGITKLFAHNAQDAVEFTRGLILSYNDKICDARFSKSCGGVSEAFENVWEPHIHPYLTPIVDYKFSTDYEISNLREEECATKWIKDNPPAFCNTTDKNVLSQVLLNYDQKTTDFYRWEVEYSQETISKLIKEKSGIDFGNILDLIPIERGDSSRLIKLKIVGDKKTLTIGKELEIRRILSTTHLYSSAFVVEKSDINNNIPGNFKLIGAGWGHGVGLCQIGAAVMSEMGYYFDEILIHYYKGAEIKRYYE